MNVIKNTKVTRIYECVERVVLCVSIYIYMYLTEERDSLINNVYKLKDDIKGQKV